MLQLQLLNSLGLYIQPQTEGTTAISETHLMQVGDDTTTASSTNTLNNRHKKNPPPK